MTYSLATDAAFCVIIMTASAKPRSSITMARMMYSVREVERRRFRELPEEWANRAFLAGLRQR
jgi:hypothetical protein